MISVSMCMIVKNEQSILKRCLDSYAGIYDELIIVDTGSTDNTKEIAAQYTDKVYNFAWCDDFAEARNFAFSKASCDYILSVDADEELDFHNNTALRSLKEAILPEIDIVQMYYVNESDFNSVYNVHKELRPKLFRRIRTFNWISPIHETIRVNPVIYDSDIEIMHKPTSDHSKRDFSIYFKALDKGIVLEDYVVTMLCKELFISGEASDFIAFKNAFENGASAVISDRDIDDSEHIIIKVKDTLKALQDMAHYLRKHRKVKVVGITGSVGKTSTRDMVYSVIKQQYKTLKTEGNYNNSIGLPLTILRLKDEQVMVLEMGMNHLKEMEELSMIACPDISAITNVGTAHIGELGSRENILKAKMEIINGMSDNSMLVINNDNDMLSTVEVGRLNLIRVGIDNGVDFKANNVVLSDEGSTFDFEYKGKVYFVDVPVPGKHFVMNALIAIAIGLQLDISPEQCIKGVKEFELTRNRMDIVELKNNITLIDGTYNASEDSMKSSIDVLATYTRRKIAVLADMLELGKYSEQLHRNIGMYVAKNKIDILVAVGKESKYIIDAASKAGVKQICYCNSNEEVINYLEKIIQSNDVILFKGSNGMKLGNVVALMKEKLM